MIIFSHGFGTRKDDRGLFPDIIVGLKNVEAVMFDYNDINESENVISVKSLSRQASILKEVVEKLSNQSQTKLLI